jgi:enoyl-CoA hydratase/carnithine racemase
MQTLEFRVEDRVGHLVLSRPPGNLMDAAFFRDLDVWVRKELPDASLGALVVYGAGRHFCAGADVDALVKEVERGRDGGGALPDLLLRNLRSLEVLENLGIPVIAAVRGACLGLGMELALACPLRVAAATAVFGLPETTFGLLPGCGGVVRLREIAGRAEAARLILCGGRFDADRAHDLGIVHRVVPSGRVVDEALGMARAFAASDRLEAYPELFRRHCS